MSTSDTKKPGRTRAFQRLSNLKCLALKVKRTPNRLEAMDILLCQVNTQIRPILAIPDRDTVQWSLKKPIIGNVLHIVHVEMSPRTPNDDGFFAVV